MGHDNTFKENVKLARDVFRILEYIACNIYTAKVSEFVLNIKLSSFGNIALILVSSQKYESPAAASFPSFSEDQINGLDYEYCCCFFPLLYLEKTCSLQILSVSQIQLFAFSFKLWFKLSLGSLKRRWKKKGG